MSLDPIFHKQVYSELTEKEVALMPVRKQVPTRKPVPTCQVQVATLDQVLLRHFLANLTSTLGMQVNMHKQYTQVSVTKITN